METLTKGNANGISTANSSYEHFGLFGGFNRLNGRRDGLYTEGDLMNAAQKIQRLYQVRAERRQMEREERALRKAIEKEMVGGILEAGGYVAMLKERERKSLDRVGLEAEFGREVIEKYEKVTNYRTLEISEVKS